jgi:hypothetical protein
MNMNGDLRGALMRRLMIGGTATDWRIGGFGLVSSSDRSVRGG